MIFGLLLTLLQIGFVVLLQQRPSLDSAYRRLYQWDSRHYGEIAETGYYSTLTFPLPERYTSRDIVRKTNVAFFPAYPVLGRIFVRMRIPTRYAMLIAAQLSCWAFWTSLLLLLRTWRVGPMVQAGAVATIVAHPAAFYLVTAYSESLFSFALIGYLLWCDVRTKTGTVLAALHGFLMTATRIIGFPLVLWPILTALLGGRRSLSDLKRPAIIALIAACGGGAFFLFCALRYGAWDLYMLRQAAGWNIHLDPLFLIRDPLWHFFLAFRREATDANYESRVAASLTLWLLIIVPLLDWWRSRDDKKYVRLSLYISGWLAFLVPASSLAANGMQSMIRYAFIPHILLILAAAHALRDVRFTASPLQLLMGSLTILAVILCLVFQITLLLRFASGGWVA